MTWIKCLALVALIAAPAAGQDDSDTAYVERFQLYNKRRPMALEVYFAEKNQVGDGATIRFSLNKSRALAA